MYLHELDNWTHFTWDNKVIAPFLGDVRFAQGRLLGRVSSLGFSLNSTLELGVLSEEVVASSRIEGVELNPASVRSSVARQLGLEDANPDLDTRSVDGAVSVMVDATQRYSEQLSFERLAGWHNALFPTGYSGLHKITVADYRKGPMSVVGGPIGHERTHYEAPSPDLVPGLMSEFLNWANTSPTDPVLKAAQAHLWFLSIHPFDDGNGRIARAITELLLSRSDGSPRRFYSMAGYILRHRTNYYNAIERAQKGTPDITDWLVWFLEALQGSIEDSGRIVDEVLRRDAWWRSIDDVPLNERQRTMLQKLLNGFEGKLTASKWAKICKVSPDTALRDINDLVSKGVLTRNPSAGGRSTSYLLRD